VDVRGAARPPLQARPILTFAVPSAVAALCIVGDFHPGAVTIEAKYLSAAGGLPLTEDVLWSYLTQLLSCAPPPPLLLLLLQALSAPRCRRALVSIHSAGLAANLSYAHILVTAKHRSAMRAAALALVTPQCSRLRLNWLGVGTLLMGGPSKPVPEAQHDDLLSLASLILCLACQSVDAPKKLGCVRRHLVVCSAAARSRAVLRRPSLEYVGARFSPELRELLGLLLTTANSPQRPTVFNVCALVSHRITADLQRAYAYADALRVDLAKEVQNGGCRAIRGPGGLPRAETLSRAAGAHAYQDGLP
jgi:hypothetical protein